MKLQRQLNAWSCILAAVATVLDEDQQKLIEEIGHDGSEIVLPTLPEPARRQGFHLQELIDCAIRREFAVTPIEVLPYSTPDGKAEFPVNFPEGNKERLFKYLHNNIGIFTGLAKQWRHAVAWDSKQIYDPHGLIYHFQDCKIKIDCFWRFDKMLGFPMV